MISTDPMPETPVTLKERRPFSLTLTCEKQDGRRLNLTGASLRLAISKTKRKGGTGVYAGVADIVSAVDGTARFDLQAEFVDFGTGLFDMAITLTSAEGYESTIIEGPVEVTRNIDPTPSTLYTDVIPPLSLTARFRDQNRVTVRVNHHPDSVLLDATNRAEDAATSAAASQHAAGQSAIAAAGSATTAATAATNAAGSATAAATSATAAAGSATSAYGSYNQAAAMAAAAVEARDEANVAAASADEAASAADFDADAAAASADAAAASAAAAAAILTNPHGNDGNAARLNAAINHWVGLARPVNAIPTDFWTKVNLS
jgi:hypothetical protein